MQDNIVAVTFDKTLYRNIYRLKSGAMYCPMNVYETLEEARSMASSKDGDEYHATISFRADYHLLNKDHFK